MAKSSFIEDHKLDLAVEFSEELGVRNKDENSSIVAFSCYTMIYKIADEFKGGILREEILKQFLDIKD